MTAVDVFLYIKGLRCSAWSISGGSERAIILCFFFRLPALVYGRGFYLLWVNT